MPEKLSDEAISALIERVAGFVRVNDLNPGTYADLLHALIQERARADSEKARADSAELRCTILDAYHFGGFQP